MPYKDPEKQKEWVKKKQNYRRDKYREYKEENPCMDCGQKWPYYVMHFDHVRGEKKFTVSKRSASFGFKLLQEEIEKCDLICGNCHSIRHHERGVVAQTVEAPV